MVATIPRPRLQLGIVMLIGLCGCVRPAQARPVVTNVRFGVLCGEEHRVCLETRAIRVTGASVCIYNHESKPCTWYGFSFDFDLPSGNRTLNCRWRSSVPNSPGNPREVVARGVTEGTYDITLPSHRGHFVNPQYTVFAPGPRVTTEEFQSCSYIGQQLFVVKYTLVYET